MPILYLEPHHSITASQIFFITSNDFSAPCYSFIRLILGSDLTKFNIFYITYCITIYIRPSPRPPEFKDRCKLLLLLLSSSLRCCCCYCCQIREIPSFSTHSIWGMHGCLYTTVAPDLGDSVGYGSRSLSYGICICMQAPGESSYLPRTDQRKGNLGRCICPRHRIWLTILLMVIVEAW